MIVATNKCGCPPKEQKPPCSPCCGSRKKADVKPSISEECPPPPPRIDDISACCPTNPPIVPSFQRPSKLRSEIVERGLPYKEIEAIINNNRLVIRTQTEPGRIEYDPPCDCDEDPRPVEQEETPAQGLANRTVTLFPRPKDEDDVSNSENEDDGGGIKMKGMVPEPEANPNIFLLRVRRKSVTGDKRCNIDLEFKTPRPWSTKKILEYTEQQTKPPRTEIVPMVKTDGDEGNRRVNQNVAETKTKQKC